MGSHGDDVVVDVSKEDGLVAQRNPRVGQPCQGIADLGGEFARMIRMNADEERMVFLQHGAQLRRDPLREENGNS